MNVPRTLQPIDPIEFASVAHDLASRSGEANLRAAVGRLYCGNFLLAREKSRIVTEVNVHWEIIRVTSARNKTFGTHLVSLAYLRKLADYNLSPQQAADQDWSVNWRKAQFIANVLLSGLQRLVQY